MDFLTHLCLPVTVAYVLYREVFESPAILLLAGFGLLPDADKFLGMPGLLHSLVTLVPIAVLLVGLERAVRGETTYATVAVALAFSHLLLDFVDGGPVPLLYPFVAEGIGLQYPIRTVFGQGPLGLAFEGPLVRLRVLAPRPGYNTYGFIKGAGVASLLAFLTVYFGTGRGERGATSSTRSPSNATGVSDRLDPAETDGGVESGGDRE